MDNSQACNLIEKRLLAGANKLWCYNTCLVWGLDLRYCCAGGHTEVVKVLLEAGADVHACDDNALQWANRHGHTETVKVLLEAGADVHADDDWVLRLASIGGQTEVVKVLEDWIAAHG